MLSPVQHQSTPWLSEKDGHQEAEEAPKTEIESAKSVQWYQPLIKSLPVSTVEFFGQYSGIMGEEAVKRHIYEVRDRAWKVLPYPCIGLFRFLDFSIHLSPDYPEVVRRVQAGATLLDLGCCFGQDLRRLAHDAGTSSRLIGCDIEASFLDLGYDLFLDRGRLEAAFLPGNVFSQDFLAQYRGKVDIIYLGSFLHLFTEAQQRAVVAQIGRLLRPDKDCIVFGRQLGAEKGGPFRMDSIGWDLYRHDHSTIVDLFRAHDGDKSSNLEWRVSSSLSRYGSVNWDDDRRSWQGEDTKQMMFTAIRASAKNRSEADGLMPYLGSSFL